MTSTTKPVFYKLPTGKWRVVDAPDDWQFEQGYPGPSSEDREFDTKEEAEEEFERRIASKTPSHD